MTAQDRLFDALSSLAIKAPCRAASTANLTLSGLQTVDTVALAQNDRVLAKNQTTGSENGILLADTGTWKRAPDFDGNRDAVKGTLTKITDGSANGDTYWTITTANPIVIGTTSITFAQTVNSLAGVSAFIETLLDDTDAVTARQTLLLDKSGADIASAATIDLDASTGDFVDVTGTVTITAITLGDGVEKTVRFTGSLTLTQGASLVIEGSANIQTAAGDVAVFRGDASSIVRLVKYFRLQSHGSDVASAATINLDAATGDLIDVTGTVTITAVTLAEGRERTVRFTGVLTLTHGASLVLPGSANIATVVGDFAIFRGYSGGVVRIVNYMPVTVPPQRPISAASGASGTAVDFTSLPSWITWIDIDFAGVSLTGTDTILVQLGDGGGVETTGYVSTSNRLDQAGGSAGVNNTTGFAINTFAAANSVNGHVRLTNLTGNEWVSSHSCSLSTTVICGGAGDKTLTAKLDRIRITRSGTDTFDTGTFAIHYG